jgi:hypothetical protein
MLIGPGMNQARSWVKPAPTGALRQLHDSDGISASWRYNLSIPSIVGGGEAFGGLATAAFGLDPLWLSEGAATLAQAWVVVKSTIMILSASSTGSCHSGSCGWVVAVACLPASLRPLPLLRSASLLKGVTSVPSHSGGARFKT